MATTTLENIILKTVDLPAIPMVAAKVMRLIDSPNCSLNELQEVISGDPAVVSRLLRIANSSFYSGGRREIDSAEAAVMAMGFDTLKNMVLASSIKQVYKHFGLFEKMSWEHSLGVSMAAGMLAKQFGIRQDEAATAGLLHDIGKVVINNAMPDRYSQIIETVYNEHVRTNEVEDTDLGFNHCQVGELVAKKWKLSSALVMAIAYHHFPERIPEEEKEHRTLCELVNLTDNVCQYLGIGGSEPIMTALDRVDMDKDELFKFVDEFKGKFVTEKLKFI